MNPKFYEVRVFKKDKYIGTVKLSSPILGRFVIFPYLTKGGYKQLKLKTGIIVDFIEPHKYMTEITLIADKISLKKLKEVLWPEEG